MSSPSKSLPQRSAARGRQADAARSASILSHPLLQRPWVRYTLAVVAVTVAIVVWKSDVYDSPPYYDFATGLFVEANYLAETNFDYGQLVQEKRWLEGGPAVYITSVLPTLLAVMMKTLPTARAVLVAYHLFIFLCAAISLVLVYALLEPRAGRVGAVLTALALVTVPIFSTQVDMLGMDIPLAPCALACLWCFCRQRYALAAVFALAAVSIKQTGLVVVLAGGATLLPLLFLSYLSRDGESRRKYWIGLGAFGIALLATLSLTAWVEGLPTSDSENWLIGAHDLSEGIRFQKRIFDWSFDQVVMGILALIGTYFAFRGWLVAALTGTAADLSSIRLMRAARDSLRDRPVLVFSWLIVGGLFAAFVKAYSLPRYLVLGMPFLYLILGSTWFGQVVWRRWVSAAFACVVAINLLNSDGRLLAEKFDSQGRTGALLERSREYLEDHRSNIEAIQALAELPEGATVIAGNPFVQMLSLPRLGYVERPLQGYALNTFTSPTFKNGSQNLVKDLPRDVYVVYVESAMTPAGAIPQPTEVPGSTIEPVYSDAEETPLGKQSPLVVYRRRWSPEVSAEDLATYYRSAMFGQLNPIAQAESLRADGKFDDAAALYASLMASDSDNADVRLGYGRVLVDLKQYEKALEQFREAVRLAPQHAEAREWLGAHLAGQGKYDEAIAELTEAVELDKTSDRSAADKARTLDQLARAYLKAERYAEAADAWREGIDLDREKQEFHYQLSNALLHQRKSGEAAAALREALRLRPDWPDAANSLGWILATDRDPALRNGPEAVEVLLRAKEVADPDQAIMVYLLDTLAAAYAESGQYGEATAAARQAIELMKKLQLPAVPGIEDRLHLYESGKPYHEGEP